MCCTQRYTLKERGSIGVRSGLCFVSLCLFIPLWSKLIHLKQSIARRPGDAIPRRRRSRHVRCHSGVSMGMTWCRVWSHCRGAQWGWPATSPAAASPPRWARTCRPAASHPALQLPSPTTPARPRCAPAKCGEPYRRCMCVPGPATTCSVNAPGVAAAARTSCNAVL